MEAKATQHTLSALWETMRQPSRTKVSPTLSRALHLPLTATTFIVCRINPPFGYHNWASRNNGLSEHTAHPTQLGPLPDAPVHRLQLRVRPLRYRTIAPR